MGVWRFRDEVAAQSDPKSANRLAKVHFETYDHNMQRWIWIAGGVGFLAVAMGAFGAHALRSSLSADMLSVYQTAVLYHLVHAIALWALVLFGAATGSSVKLPASLFLAGIALFSGSLYALSITGTRGLGAITPLGGLCFLAAWVTAAWTVNRASLQEPKKR